MTYVHARTTTEALMARAGVKAAFGHNPRLVREWKETRPWTRMGSLLRMRFAEVRQRLEEVRRAKKGGSAGAKVEVLGKVGRPGRA